MSFNLVICCDGTNNSLQRDLTNVALLSMVVDKTPGLQHVYYDAGVGVDAAPGLVTRIGATISVVGIGVRHWLSRERLRRVSRNR